MKMRLVARHMLHCLGSNPDLYFAHGRLHHLREVRRLAHAIRCGPDIDEGNVQPTTAIVLSYRRPWNIEYIVRSLLRCTCIEHIIVSNNNPAVRMDRWLRIRDPRITMIMQHADTGAVMRYQIARSAPGNFFLSIDDDVYLLPEQIVWLLRALQREPDVPHGFFGERLIKPIHENADQAFEHGIVNQEREVDILNRVYCFTPRHVRRYFELLDTLNIRDPEGIRRLSIADDVVLSFTGIRRPRIHDIGTYLNCPTSGMPGIAQWKERGFREERRRLYLALCALTGRTVPMSDSAATAPSPATGRTLTHR